MTNIEELINLLGKPNYILTKVTSEDILNDADLISYNPSEAKSKVNMYAKNKPTFYRKDNDLYILYSLEGFKVFASFSLFSSGMDNYGFRIANILDCAENTTLVYITGIGANKNECADNTKDNRKKFAQMQLTVTKL